MNPGDDLKNILEAALLAAGKTLTLEQLQGLFEEHEQPERKAMRAALETLNEDYEGRGIEVREVSSGWRIQVRKDYAAWVSRLWDEKPGRYSRALMETLALIAYRQPITRGEIEDIRGVSVSTHITKTLLEREWVRVVGHRDVPGKPALYGTTREFLDYFDLKSLDDLPPLAELRDLDEINRELNLADPEPHSDQASMEAGAPEGEEPGESTVTEADTGPEGEAGQDETGETVEGGTPVGTPEPKPDSASGRVGDEDDVSGQCPADQSASDPGPEDQTDAPDVLDSADTATDNTAAVNLDQVVTEPGSIDVNPSDTPVADEAEAEGLEEPERHG